MPNLKVGTYEIAAEISGFKRAIQKDVPLNVQQRLQVDFTLEVGDLSENVTVAATRPRCCRRRRPTSAWR